jgi:hypothetical protein
LRSQGKDAPAKLADQAADRAERLGEYLTRADADTILSDVEDLTRKAPWAVALGGLAVGFAASRFLKASSQKRHERGGGTRRGALPESAAQRDGAAGGPGAPPQMPAAPVVPASGLAGAAVTP